MTETTPTCWIITEGKAGTENQCLGVAEALGVTPIIKHFKLRAPWLQLSPWLRWGHQYALRTSSPRLDPPYPDLVIASGRKSIGLALHVKKMSGGKTFVVQIQDPVLDPSNFDLVVVPKHDKARGENVMVAIGSLHRVTAEKISSEMKKFEFLAQLPHPRVAVLIGGNSKSYQMTPAATQQLVDQLKSIKGSLMITASRRTGEENAATLRNALKGENIYFWDGQGPNPYFALLGYADHIVVTEDSVSMATEAVSTGKPVHVAALEGGSRRFKEFHEAMRDGGYTKPFTGTLETWSYIALNDTLKVAEEIRRRMKLKGT